MTDIALNKKESIERCLKQVREYYARPSEVAFEQDFLKQDAIGINLQRACEQCIDLANHVIKVRKLGLPKESRESFTLLANAGIIPLDMSDRLKGMIGFRNTLVHEYQRLDINLMVDVIENHLDDLIDYTNLILKEMST